MDVVTNFKACTFHEFKPHCGLTTDNTDGLTVSDILSLIREHELRLALELKNSLIACYEYRFWLFYYNSLSRTNKFFRLCIRRVCSLSVPVPLRTRPDLNWVFCSSPTHETRDDGWSIFPYKMVNVFAWVTSPSDTYTQAPTCFDFVSLIWCHCGCVKYVGSFVRHYAVLPTYDTLQLLITSPQGRCKSSCIWVDKNYVKTMTHTGARLSARQFSAWTASFSI